MAVVQVLLALMQFQAKRVQVEWALHRLYQVQARFMLAAVAVAFITAQQVQVATAAVASVGLLRQQGLELVAQPISAAVVAVLTLVVVLLVTAALA